MRTDEYLAYLERASEARTPGELAAMRAELRATWPEDATAQLLNEVLLEYERSFEWPPDARPQTAAVWYGDPALSPRAHAPPPR
jgi:hypothetical protein